MSTPTLKQLSQSTQNYISMVTDPYHDRNLRVSGYPDGRCQSSTVRRFTGATTIACPVALGPGDSWRFHVFTTPLHTMCTLYAANAHKQGNLVQTAAPLAQALGPVNVAYYIKYAASPTETIIFKPLGSYTDSNEFSSMRTVSLAYELHNTTPAIYASGSITNYRLNTVNQEDQRVDAYLYDPARSLISYSNGCFYPETIDQANRMPNSHTWEATAGSYSVALPAHHNSFSSVGSQRIVLRFTNDENDKSAFITNTSSSLTNGPQGAPTSCSPISCVGTISSMYQDSNQTFTLDFRQVLEAAVSPYSIAACTYATTAPEADLAFLKLYKRMFNNIPPGVPVSFNSAGEWFRRILQLAKEQLPNIVSVLPPNAQIIARSALPLVNSVADAVIRRLDKPKQPKQRPPPVKKTTLSKKRVERLIRTSHAFGAKTQRFVPSKKQ